MNKKLALILVVFMTVIANNSFAMNRSEKIVKYEDDKRITYSGIVDGTSIMATKSKEDDSIECLTPEFSRWIHDKIKYRNYYLVLEQGYILQEIKKVAEKL